jgi:hypothetical protein
MFVGRVVGTFVPTNPPMTSQGLFFHPKEIKNKMPFQLKKDDTNISSKI